MNLTGSQSTTSGAEPPGSAARMRGSACVDVSTLKDYIDRGSARRIGGREVSPGGWIGACGCR